MSQAGKETLIKAVVQAIPAYVMACFVFPKFNSYISNFWWGGDPEGRGFHWTSWGLLSMSKLEGGLGFRDFHQFNLALLARQGWRLVKYPNSFCVRILKGIYFPHSNFMEASKGRRASWAWASFLQGRDILRQGIRWQVNSGTEEKFWEDRWIPYVPGFKVTSPKPRGSDLQSVCDAIDSTMKRWKVADLRLCVFEVEVEAITSIPIALNHTPDSLIWHFDSKGIYSV